MLTMVFWTAAALAASDWVATAFGWRNVRLLTKPATLLVLIAWFIQAGGPFWFSLGLIFSLAGDVLLMLPARFFLGGLAAFLLAHVAYIIGFGLLPLPLHWGALLALIAVVAAGLFSMSKIRKGVRANPNSQKMLIPIQGYSLIISLMLFAALLTLMRPEWPLQAALFASVGAALFFISDSVLAYCRFCGRLFADKLIVMVTYHLAQFSIALAVIVSGMGNL
ncbi:MAG TPA: lysoplasmalogenase [Levilinea sp.]|nr:lysoplasmalogenase [Levilinea sp.]